MTKRMLALLVMLLLMVSAMPVLAEEAPANEWTNILLLGGDARTDENSDTYDRTDTIIVVSINRQERQMKLTSIMRDTYVRFAGKNYSAKINAANVYGGPQLTIDTINLCFDMGIEDYLIVNMADLVHIIDLVGGVEVEVNSSERGQVNKYARDYLRNIGTYEGQTSLEETGRVKLNGLLAVSYLRDRYTDSDFYRVMRQQEVLLAMGQAVQDMDFDESMAIVDDVMQYVSTSLESEELKELAMMLMSVDIACVEQFRLPAGSAYTTGSTETDSYRIYPNLEKNRILFQEFLNGPAAQ